MSGKINLKELREFAGLTRDHPNELVYSDAVLALVEAVEAAQELIYGEPDIEDGELSRDRHRANLIYALARFEGGAS